MALTPSFQSKMMMSLLEKLAEFMENEEWVNCFALIFVII